MKTTIKFICIMMFLQISSSVFSSDFPSADTLNKPQKAIIISEDVFHNFSEDCFIYTVIDLRNYEMVILYYETFKLRKVVRTGIILDPDRQVQFMKSNHPYPN